MYLPKNKNGKTQKSNKNIEILNCSKIKHNTTL